MSSEICLPRFLNSTPFAESKGIGFGLAIKVESWARDELLEEIAYFAGSLPESVWNCWRRLLDRGRNAP